MDVETHKDHHCLISGSFSLRYDRCIPFLISLTDIGLQLVCQEYTFVHLVWTGRMDPETDTCLYYLRVSVTSDVHRTLTLTFTIYLSSLLQFINKSLKFSSSYFVPSWTSG